MNVTQSSQATYVSIKKTGQLDISQCAVFFDSMSDNFRTYTFSGISLLTTSGVVEDSSTR